MEARPSHPGKVSEKDEQAGSGVNQYKNGCVYMHKSFEKMKWEDIYSYWKVSTEGYMNIVNRAPLPSKIAVDSSGNNRIYTYLWLNRGQLDEVKSEMKHMTVFSDFRFRNTPTDERVMRAADLMVQAKSDEERAAIWMWIFCSSLENAKLPYPIRTVSISIMSVQKQDCFCKNILKSGYSNIIIGFRSCLWTLLCLAR